MKKFALLVATLAIVAFMAGAPSALGQLPPGAAVPDDAKCREILDNANSIVYTWDNQTRVTYINPFGLRYFGFTKDELIGQSFVGKFVPATSSSGQDLAHMIRDIARHPEAYASNENQNLKKNGERVEVLWSNSAIRDDKGNVVEIISVGNVRK